MTDDPAALAQRLVLARRRVDAALALLDAAAEFLATAPPPVSFPPSATLH